MKQEFIHKVSMDNILLGPSISKHDKPKKLMVMLHGYGDNAANFIHLAEPLDQDEWGNALCSFKCTKYYAWQSNGLSMI